MNWPFGISIGVCVCAVLGWNGANFLGTKQQPRTKDLEFLPPPVVAQALSLGQSTAMAKLRWIDSFAYFQLQLDRRNDQVAGEDVRGGFERLYDTLIAMDPLFIPFYEHAVLNTGGVLNNHKAALSFLMRGLIEMPRDSGLWRLSSAELAISFGWSSRASSALDRWLAAWAAAEPNEAGRQQITDWRRSLAFTHVDGLETLPYWLGQLQGTKPGSPFADFVEGTVRELLAEHGARQLTRVSAADASAGAFVSNLLPGSQLLSLEISQQAFLAHWPKGVPAWAPVRWQDGQLKLRPDPFGYPWQHQAGKIVSPGREQRRFLGQQQGWRDILEAKANERGRPPRDITEAMEWGVELPPPPFGGRWSFENRLPDVIWPAPPHQPWPLR